MTSVWRGVKSPSVLAARRHTDGVTRYAVLAESASECATGLARLCEALGLEPTVGPVRLTDGRWLARAVTPAPDVRGMLAAAAAAR